MESAFDMKWEFYLVDGNVVAPTSNFRRPKDSFLINLVDMPPNPITSFFDCFQHWHLLGKSFTRFPYSPERVFHTSADTFLPYSSTLCLLPFAASSPCFLRLLSARKFQSHVDSSDEIRLDQAFPLFQDGISDNCDFRIYCLKMSRRKAMVFAGVGEHLSLNRLDFDRRGDLRCL
jgi:hypothetical protein